MSDAHKGKRGEKAIQRAPSPLSPSIYDNEIPLGSPVSKPAVASPLTRIRFLPRELPDGVRSPSAMSSATMETHILDVESPGATLERKKQGGGIVYFPPENLAEYLDSSLVTPVTGGATPTPRGSVRSSNGGRIWGSLDKPIASDEEDSVEADAPGANTELRASASASASASTPRSEATLFYCAYCMRNKPGADRRRFEGNGGCSHEFCKECLGNYLFHRITVGHHTLHPCPKFGEQGCRASASNEDVKLMARVDVFEEHCKRLEGHCGACEECGHRGRRSSSQPSPPPPPPPPPSLSLSSVSSRERAAPAAGADEDHTCQSCGSTRKRHLHLHLHHHHHNNHHHNHHHQNHPTTSSTVGDSAVGKSTRRWLPRRAASSAGVDATAASANGDNKAQRQRRQKRREMTLTAAALTTVEVDGRAAKKEGAGQESPRWWSPREWWTKTLNGRNPSRR